MTKRNITVLLLLAFAPLSFAAKPAASVARACESLSKFEMPGYRIEIRGADRIPESAVDAVPFTPAHCRVDGIVDPYTGQDGKSYGIGFAVAMPDNWNGRFLFQGGGGLNGSVQNPLGAQYAAERSALARGFAVATTDSGHRGEGFDGSFFNDQKATLNFLHQGVATTTVVAKQIVARHYGKISEHSYFVGCSTGGREAMMMSQRYPDYFDGIIASAPAMRTSFSNLGLRHGTAALNAIAPKDGERPDTRRALSDSDRDLVIHKLLEACDPLDGNRDGFIFATQECRFDPAALACKGRKQDGCLTSGQVDAINRIARGPLTAQGRQVYPGYYFDTGIANAKGLPGILVGPIIPESRPVGVTIDVDSEATEAMTARAMVGDTNAWTNLGSFRAHGGKLIFIHGISDPWFSAKDTVGYYERLQADNPGQPLEYWSRLFLVPGMGHCAGGERTLDQFDALQGLVDWVEGDHPPERIIATGASAPGESRPLCPHPTHAHYQGTGDAHHAGSYVCQR